MISKLSPLEIVSLMMKHDAFSRWLGIKVLTVSVDCVSLKMKVTKEMLNGLHIAHGGITYSLGDSCMAFAANSEGYKRVSIETSIIHKLPLKENEVIIATSKLISQNKKVKEYQVEIVNSEKMIVAIFKGQAYNTRSVW